jgi:hypothetical protein
VSIGVSTTATDAPETRGSMLQRADAALYEAKRGGRNCVRASVSSQTSTSPSAQSNPPVVDTGSVEYA